MEGLMKIKLNLRNISGLKYQRKKCFGEFIVYQIPTLARCCIQQDTYISLLSTGSTQEKVLT